MGDIAIEESKGIEDGSWDSIHIATVNLEDKKARYRLTSNVFLKMKSAGSYGKLQIAGNLSKTVFNLQV